MAGRHSRMQTTISRSYLTTARAIAVLCRSAPPAVRIRVLDIRLNPPSI